MIASILRMNSSRRAKQQGSHFVEPLHLEVQADAHVSWNPHRLDSLKSRRYFQMAPRVRGQLPLSPVITIWVSK